MGEAKQKRAAMEEALRFEIEVLMAPVTSEEAYLLTAIESLPFLDIPRASPASLQYMKTEGQHCHANARWFEEYDPSGESRSVTGWWRRRDVFYFHSVVLYQGQLVCITPGPDVPPLCFAPDPEVRWMMLDGGPGKAERLGCKVPPVVRRDPAAVIVACQKALHRLEAGEHPLNIRIIGLSIEPRTSRSGKRAFLNLI